MSRIGGQQSGHIRWHVRRGLVNPTCALCGALPVSLSPCP
jgi:hypothetical protein